MNYAIFSLYDTGPYFQGEVISIHPSYYEACSALLKIKNMARGGLQIGAAESTLEEGDQYDMAVVEDIRQELAAQARSARNTLMRYEY